MSNKYNQALDLLKARQYDEALLIFNQLLDKEPMDANILSERGVCYLHMNNKEASLADMDQAVHLEPLKSYRYSSRAYTRSFFGDLTGGIEDYKKAIELDPEDAIAHNNLGLLEEKLGYTKQSQKNFERADILHQGQIDGRTEQGIEGLALKSRNIQKEIEDAKEKLSYSKVLLSIFSKSGFQSFVKFVKTGFKEI